MQVVNQHETVIDWHQELATRSVSQAELAADSGLNPATVSRIVTGKRAGWPETRRRLVRALHRYPPLFAVDDGE